MKPCQVDWQKLVFQEKNCSVLEKIRVLNLRDLFSMIFTFGASGGFNRTDFQNFLNFERM